MRGPRSERLPSFDLHPFPACCCRELDILPHDNLHVQEASQFPRSLIPTTWYSTARQYTSSMFPKHADFRATSLRASLVPRKCQTDYVLYVDLTWRIPTTSSHIRTGIIANVNLFHLVTVFVKKKTIPRFFVCRQRPRNTTAERPIEETVHCAF